MYPKSALERAGLRSLSLHIACDIHPLNNLRILRYLGNEMGQSQEAINHWYAHWITRGFAAVENAVQAWPGAYSLGDHPGMLEVMLVPQVYNARRFNVPLEAFPAIVELDARCQLLDAFARAHPSVQPDTPPDERP